MQADLGGETLYMEMLAQRSWELGRGGMRDGVRDVHQQLLVGIAAEFGLRTQSLVPCLLANLASRTRGALVQSVDGVKVDLFVEAVLQSRSDVV